jgi:hypothetical protein
MPALRTYKVFVSHAWKYGDQYDRVVRMLDSAPYFSWKNLSVPEHDPIHAGKTDALSAELRNQMRPANVFVILAGMYVAHSDWIDFEIEFSRRIGRPIIGITPWGAHRTPDAVSRAAVEMVGWNTDSIVRAIRTHALEDGR